MLPFSLGSRTFIRTLSARLIACAVMSIAVFPCFTQQAVAQDGEIRFVEVPYDFHSGFYSGNGQDFSLVYSEVIKIDRAPWMRLLFGSFNLGHHSFLTITSLKDGGTQKLTSETLKQWNNGSAFFNGDAVEICVHAAPSDENVFFEVAGVISGVPDPGGTRDTCEFDDRVPSTDPAVGRIIYQLSSDPPNIIHLCTGWIFSNGAHLTAGHCLIGPATLAFIEFNVPPSSSAGIINYADPDDQYMINHSSVVFHNDGEYDIGDDWAVFACYRNSNTGLLPVEAQGEFARGVLSVTPANARVTGFGEDHAERSYTQQTDAGEFLGMTVEGPSDVILEYLVDSEGGNSGGPIYHAEAPDYAIGVHTNGGCNPPSHGNQGTGFENDALMVAINNFYGSPVVHVDGNHVFTLDLGLIFDPKITVGGAATGAAEGSIISIVTGSYDETVLVDKAMVFVAPVGPVIIGE